MQAASPARVAPAQSISTSEGTGRGKVVWENTGQCSHLGSTATRSFRTRTQDGATGNRISLSIGAEILKKYDIKALIGKGSFSQVLRVENKTSEELYALKVIEKKVVEGNRYESELNVLRRVRHPNIIRLYEVFHSNTKIYMLLELAAGGDLFDRIYSRGHFTERRGKSVIRMVLSGVAYLHGIGIAHRDLKPENLLYKYLGDNSRIMISDFGLAYMKTADDDVMSTTCGTAEYLAPEMLEGEVYTELVDLWALGVVTYIILCGKMPFVEDSRARLYQKISRGQFSFKEEVCVLHIAACNHIRLNYMLFRCKGY